MEKKAWQKKRKILLICTLTYRQKNVLRIIKHFRKISIRSSWSIVSFKVCVSLLIFCLVDLSIDVSGVLKSPTIIVLLLISSFILVSICLTYCGYTSRGPPSYRRMNRAHGRSGLSWKQKTWGGNGCELGCFQMQVIKI